MGKQAVAWIKSFLEPVCRKGGKRGPARPAVVETASWNPAEMGKPWEETEKNPFQTWWRRISGQQSEKIVTSEYWII